MTEGEGGSLKWKGLSQKGTKKDARSVDFGRYSANCGSRNHTPGAGAGVQCNLPAGGDALKEEANFSRKEKKKISLGGGGGGVVGVGGGGGGWWVWGGGGGVFVGVWWGGGGGFWGGGGGGLGGWGGGVGGGWGWVGCGGGFGFERVFFRGGLFECVCGGGRGFFFWGGGLAAFLRVPPQTRPTSSSTSCAVKVRRRKGAVVLIHLFGGK